MSKIRNSLGVLVLPVPYDQMTWEQYKDKYGIDLDQVFENDENDLTTFKPDFSKMILLSASGSADSTVGALPSVKPLIATEGSMTNGLILAYAVMVDNGNLVARYGLHINAMDRLVNMYEL